MSSAIPMQTASVFESFNARALSPELVAKSFIPSKAFHDLTIRGHSIVIGPRGSGKTSLLKMLQPRALESWRSADANNYRARVDYTGVFIPTDISWNRQSLAIVSNLSPEISRAIRGASFTTYVLHELIDSFIWRSESPNTDVSYQRVTLDKEDEKHLVHELSKSWHLKPSTATLIGLRNSLIARNVDIWSIAQRQALLGSESTALPDWLTLEFSSCTVQAVQLFNSAIHKQDGLWALLFDELELAPDWIMKGLVTALRSSHPNLLFKLAVSPFNEKHEELTHAVQAVPDQDYNEIRLSNPLKEEGEEFSRKLILSVCAEKGIQISDISQLVGHSFLEIDPSDAKAYTKDSKHYQVLAAALEHDPSFADYWKANKLDLQEIGRLSENERAAKIRKVYPIVVIRNFYRAAANSKLSKQQTVRGRKAMSVYAGASSILTIAEGNPRWIIGLTRMLLHNSTPEKYSVPQQEQVKHIEDAIHKFRARLKTISWTANENPGHSKSLISLLDSIGFYMREHVLLDRFHPQPPLSIIIDSNASDELISAVGRAVNVGALVYVPEKGASEIVNNVKGKRFRLSYLLAPFYQLPLRLGSAVSISRVLAIQGRNTDTTPSLL
jgi:hypothetical protein